MFSIPSIIGYNVWLEKSVRDAGIEGLLTKGEYEGLIFLKSQPEGVVMASLRYNSFIPYYTDKKAVFFSGRGYSGELEERKTDYEKFYSNITDLERLSIIQKYKINYVLFGQTEVGVSNNTLNFDKIPTFKKIFDKDIKIYEVQSSLS